MFSYEADVKQLIEFEYAEVFKEEFYLEKIDEIREVYQHSTSGIDYLWVTLRTDGMLIAVGKTSIKNDDLFKVLGKGGMNDVQHASIMDIFKTKAEKLLLTTAFSQEVLDEYSAILRKYEQMIEEINGFLLGYIHYAFAIPVNPEPEMTVLALEQDLGDTLAKEIPILNLYSHRNQK